MKKSNPTQMALNLGLFASATAIGFLLFIFPTRQFSSLTHFDFSRFQKFQGLAIFCFALLALILTALKTWWLSYRATTSHVGTTLLPRTQFAGPLSSQKTWWTVANIALSVAILVGAIRALDTPLDIDENIHALMMTRGLYGDELDPVKSDARVYFTQNHILAQAASIASMEIFGFEKIPYRAPAILFTGLLLLIIPLCFRSLFPTAGYFLTLAFLASNAFSLWYLHSARGYVSLLWVTALSYFLALRVLEDRSRKLYLWAYAATVILSPFVHFFSMIFHLLLAIALVFWVALNQQGVSREKSRAVFKLIVAQALVLPLYLFVLARNLMFLSSIGDFEKNAVEFNLWANITKAFGLAFDWQARAFLLFSFGLVVYALFHRPALFKRFSSVFIGTCIVFFGFVLTLFDAKVFEARFILAFVLPFAVWMIDGSFYLARGRAQRWTAALALTLLLIVFPAMGHKAIYRTLTFNLQDFDDGIKAVKQLTGPIEKNCYLFSGKRDLSIFAKDFYFKKAKQAAFADEDKMACQQFYHLRIEPNRAGSPVPLTRPPRAIELWNNNRGMALYLENQNSFVATRD